MITDLALASQSIPSFTISSLTLLSAVLESHPPSAIVTHVDFLPHVLELIYDSHELDHHTVIVVGDMSAAKDYAKLASHVNLIRFSDIEKEGANTQLGTPPQIGKTFIVVITLLANRFLQIQKLFTLSHSRNRLLASFKLCSLHTRISPLVSLQHVRLCLFPTLCRLWILSRPLTP